MANLKVAIYLSAKINGQWSYFRPVTGANNKIKPDWCHVNGHTEHHPSSSYVIRWYEGDKQRMLNCKNAADAVNQAETLRAGSDRIKGHFEAVDKEHGGQSGAA